MMEAHNAVRKGIVMTLSELPGIATNNRIIALRTEEEFNKFLEILEAEQVDTSAAHAHQASISYAIRNGGTGRFGSVKFRDNTTGVRLILRYGYGGVEMHNARYRQHEATDRIFEKFHEESAEKHSEAV